ncbi:DUF1636 domain-containing protein [Stappia sp. MMSF_3263]|uniref:DUF1636 domain-containing protein n=1 Tax=Stappia sp. MMSF_3263 TaxID=3046693 RepID=UPI00273E034A|nr:DUF1636 domain-containing protein [Stappia sp. MMSF_3263]
MAHDMAAVVPLYGSAGGQRRHRIVVCTTCRNRETREQPGTKLATLLEAELSGVGFESFEVSVVACMAGCDRPCAVAFQGDGKASYLFGDIEPGRDGDALVAFARQYAELDDGWCSSIQRPEGLKGKTISRIPALLPHRKERP